MYIYGMPDWGIPPCLGNCSFLIVILKLLLIIMSNLLGQSVLWQSVKGYPFEVLTTCLSILLILFIVTHGPFSIHTLEGFRYFLTLVDDCIRTTWLYLMSLKFESSIHIPTFFSMIDTQFHAKIKWFKSDNAPDLKLLEFFKNKGHIFSLLIHINKTQLLKENINIF